MIRFDLFLLMLFFISFHFIFFCYWQKLFFFTEPKIALLWRNSELILEEIFRLIFGFDLKSEVKKYSCYCSLDCSSFHWHHGIMFLQENSGKFKFLHQSSTLLLTFYSESWNFIYFHVDKQSMNQSQSINPSNH